MKPDRSARIASSSAARRAGGWLAACALFALAGPARAGGVAVLRSSDLAVYGRTVEAFRARYRDPVSEVSLAALGPAAAIAKLRESNPEVVVAVGLRAAVLVHERMPRTPMVFALVPAPERHDLIGSWVTGVTADIPPSIELGIFRALAPDVKRIGVVVGPNPEPWLGLARASARRLGIELVAAPVGGVEHVGAGLRSLLGRVDALWMPADADIASPEAFRFAMAEALRYRLPLLAFSPALVQAGAMAAAAPDLDWVGERMAEQVRRIQSGERAGDVPSTPVRRARAVANLSTARAIGRELPAQALRDAEIFR